MSLENEKRYLLLLSSYQLSKNNPAPTKAQVLDNIEDNGWIILTEIDKQKKQNRNELVWRNDLAFVRKHLAQNGWYNTSENNNWGITIEGKKYLNELHKIISLDLSDLNKVSLNAVNYAKSVLPNIQNMEASNSSQNYFEYENFQNIDGKDRYALIKARVNQGAIRKNTLKKYDTQCALCKLRFEPSLVASHIKEWAASDSTEKGDLDNILLLCPNHDALFDKHYISFDNEGKIMISSKLNNNDRVLLNIHNDMKIDMNDKMKKYMEWHRKKYLQ
ncbi:HNH endonuclease [Lachnospiraceae bacterium]|nr:HNH endonuclease [Lachnospiraceae bacterium]